MVVFKFMKVNVDLTSMLLSDTALINYFGSGKRNSVIIAPKSLFLFLDCFFSMSIFGCNRFPENNKSAKFAVWSIN